MRTHTVRLEVQGPWSLATSRRFWEGFTPAALSASEQAPDPDELRTVFVVDTDWSRAEAVVRQQGATAEVVVGGDGDLDAAAAQVARFLALDVDATAWPEVGERDEVVAEAQRRLPGLRPCGFHSPYEAAAWSVLSQRVRMVQAASLRARLTEQYGDAGAFPAPRALLDAPLDLPGRKTDYLRAVATAALDGQLDGARLHVANPDDSVDELQSIKGVGPFAAELIVLRGANAPDALPRHERRLDAIVAERYGADATLPDVAEAWRPFRTWACVQLRATGAASSMS